MAMPSAMSGAHAAWVHSCQARRQWWANMDDRVLDVEIGLRDLRARAEAEGRRYGRRIAGAAVRRRMRSHLEAIAAHEGTTIAELLASRPEAKDRIPDDLAALVPAPQEPSWAGALRSNPPWDRSSLNDD
jgi:hypothetical protein